MTTRNLTRIPAPSVVSTWYKYSLVIGGMHISDNTGQWMSTCVPLPQLQEQLAKYAGMVFTQQHLHTIIKRGWTATLFSGIINHSHTGHWNSNLPKHPIPLLNTFQCRAEGKMEPATRKSALSCVKTMTRAKVYMITFQITTRYQ